jgi:hypothetical protein
MTKLIEFNPIRGADNRHKITLLRTWSLIKQRINETFAAAPNQALVMNRRFPLNRHEMKCAPRGLTQLAITQPTNAEGAESTLQSQILTASFTI